ELCERVNFLERVELIGRRGFEQRNQLVLVQRGDDQEDRVCARRGGFYDLDRVEDEIFAQERLRDRCANQTEISQMALEKLLVGQHRDRFDTGARVILRDRDRIERLDD